MLEQQTYIKKCIKELAEITERNKPYTRLVFSEEFYSARRWLAREFNKLDLSIRTDHAGNLIGTLRSEYDNKKKVMVGSHLDTVQAGGRYDGVAGIVSSLAIAKHFRENNIKLPFHLEICDYLGEELNEWNISCLGTRGLSGLLDREILSRQDANQRILKDEINKIGGNTDKLNKKSDGFTDVLACFELHIEQGRVLEAAEKKNRNC